MKVTIYTRDDAFTYENVGEIIEIDGWLILNGNESAAFKDVTTRLDYIMAYKTENE